MRSPTISRGKTSLVPRIHEASSQSAIGQNPVRLARDWQASMREHGESRADLARRLGVPRARVTHVLGTLGLGPRRIGPHGAAAGPAMVSERALRELRFLSCRRRSNSTRRLGFSEIKPADPQP